MKLTTILFATIFVLTSCDPPHLHAQSSNPVIDGMTQGIQMRLQIERQKARKQELELRKNEDRREQERHDAEMQALRANPQEKAQSPHR